MAENSESRRSSRINKGKPPSRYPNETAPVICETSDKMSSKSRSVKTFKSARKEIERDSEREVLEVQKKVLDKQKELKLAQNSVCSIQRKIDFFKNQPSTSTQDEPEAKINFLQESLFEAEEYVQTLQIELDSMKEIAEGEIRLINISKDVELSKVDSEDDAASASSNEEIKKQRVNSWVEEQNKEVVKTPLTRVTADASNAVVRKQFYPQLTTDRSYIPKDDGVRPKSPADHPLAYDKPPVYAHQRGKKASTVTYTDSSDEDVEIGPRRRPLPPPKQETDQVTMRELVNALSQFGASNNQPQVVMKTTIDKDLPRFGGEPEEWIPFKSEFERTSNKYRFDNSENMIRLRKALVGSARSTVQHLMANVENVPLIIDSLEKRFGRPRVVLNALASRARSCSNVTTAKPESIIEFGLSIQALVANVVSYKETGYLNSVELLDSLVKKLSHDLATRWYEWLAADKSRTDNLLGFSEWTSLQLEIAYQRVEFKPEEPSADNNEKRRRRGPGQINVATTAEENCCCCGKSGHRLEKCFSFQKKSIDDRWKIIKKDRICICCLNCGHRAKECGKNRKCGINNCDKVHHRLLHYDKRNEQNERNPANNNPEEPQPREPGNVQLVGNIAVIAGCDGPLPIVPLRLSGPKGIVKCYGLLDNAASRSLMEKNLSEELGLTGEEFDYRYSGVTGSTTEKDAKRVSCEVAGTYRGSKFKKLRAAVTVQHIQINPYSIDMDEIKRKWPYLKSVPAPSLTKVKPRIIIGNNNPHLILARKIVQRQEDEPIGWRTELGWTVSGNFDNDGAGSVSWMSGVVTNDELHNLIKHSFSFEDFGVKIPSRKGANLDEKRAYDILDRTVKKVDDYWEAGLLWREDNVKFPESESAALRRLEYTEKKMKIPSYKKMYEDKIQEYLQKGYIRKLSTEEARRRNDKTFFIPHFGVTNPNKPGKFRLVLDAKSKAHGVSFNDRLLKGPDLIRSLVGILWNFRVHRIALSGDIADMFHRVHVRDEDTYSQRLVWRSDPQKPADSYIFVVLMFGASSSPCTAIYVLNRNARDFQAKYPRAVEAISKDFYVDDCLTGGDTEEEVIELRKQLSEINSAGNFVLCKWNSSSRAVLDSIPAELCANDGKGFHDKEEITGERVLGMWWNPVEDVFQFKLGLHKGRQPTKREMCGLIMSLFDPVGFIIHYKIKGMILLQETWTSGVGWDDEIPMSTFIKWKKWLSQLEELQKVKIPRCYSDISSTAEDIQLHTFVDSSSEAFSSISYLRMEKDGNVQVSFVSAKARVAPLKKSTIPRLELQAALMGARVAASIQEELKKIKINKRYFWSDSSTVLQWLHSRTGKLREFVANRVGEIQEITNLDEWNWIPTKVNIADVGTRFESEISFDPSCDWYHGPKFLFSSPSTWNFAERRKCEGTVAAVTGTDEEKRTTSKELERLRDITPLPDRFSKYWRLVRATAAVNKVAVFWIAKGRKQNMGTPWKFTPAVNGKDWLRSTMSSEDIVAAEKQLIRLAQLEEFGDEMNSLHTQKFKKGKLWRLSPVIDNEGILRVSGRIGAAADVMENVKSPIILPPRHHVTELIVDMEHVRNAHQGVETVLSNLRQQYWVIDARHTVKKSWMRCQTCRLQKCKPVIPVMAQLPYYRLASKQLPFTYSGIDLFGPIEVTVGRHHEKRWRVLICCMVTRAVHMEVVHSLSTDEVIMALSRFIDTRGRPAVIHSDNGTNFVGAAKELRQQWTKIDFTRIQEFGSFQQIKWTFNPPGAPHMGGVWERLIQAAKKCIMVTLKEKFPKDTTLLTVMKSAENILNSRPLTQVSTDPSDPEAITPNHILRGGCNAGPTIPAEMDSSDEFLRIQWKRSQVMADQFWRMWNKQYLPKLIRREKWNVSVTPLEVGTLVFVVDDQVPRNCWARGYISKTFPGKDNQVRIVEVTSRDLTGRIKTCSRPVAKVCPLGLRMEIEEPKDPQFGGQDVAE